MRNRGLDVLRGIAIMMVICNHLTARNLPGMPDLSGPSGFVLWRLYDLGWSGVDLFFVLSGFLIGGVLFKELEREGRIHFARFWIRRAFKILPSYALLLLVLGITGATGWFDHLHPMRSLMVHGLFLQNYLDPSNGPTWSLAVEEHFYLIIPALLSAAGIAVLRPRGRVRFYCASGIFCAAVLAARCWRMLIDPAPIGDAWSYTHFHMDALLVGVCAQLLVRTGSPVVAALRERPLVALAAVAALVTPASLCSRVQPAMFTIGYSALAIAYGIAVVVVTDESRVWSSARGWRMVAAIGRWSYNIYLWHWFIVLLGVPGYVPLQLAIAHLAWPPAVVVACQAIVFSSLSIGIGALMTTIFEAPVLSLRDRIAWLRMPPAASPPPDAPVARAAA